MVDAGDAVSCAGVDGVDDLTGSFVLSFVLCLLMLLLLLELPAATLV